eukprot:1996789-Rhodomonas_salina.2
MRPHWHPPPGTAPPLPTVTPARAQNEIHEVSGRCTVDLVALGLRRHIRDRGSHQKKKKKEKCSLAAACESA